MDPTTILLFVVVVPAAVAAATFLSTRRLARARDGASADVGPAVAAGVVAGYLGVAGVPTFPPVEAWQWVLPLALAGFVLAVVDVLRRSLSTRTRWTLRIVPLVAAVWFSLLHRTPTALAVLVPSILAFTWTVDRLGARATARTFLVVVFVEGVATSAAQLLAHWADGAFLAGAIAASAGAALVGAGRWPATARGAVAVVAVVLAALWIDGVLYADLPRGAATLLAVAPAVACAADVLAPRSVTGVRRAAVVVAASLASSGAAVVVTWSACGSSSY
jgi:hypothetical protein